MTVFEPIPTDCGRCVRCQQINAFKAMMFWKNHRSVPMSTEATKCASNSEIRRWLDKRAIVINGVRPGPDDIVSFPVHQIIFFEKSKRKTTMLDTCMDACSILGMDIYHTGMLVDWSTQGMLSALRELIKLPVEHLLSRKEFLMAQIDKCKTPEFSLNAHLVEEQEILLGLLEEAIDFNLTKRP